MAKKRMPTFATEAEAAQWYVDHQDKLGDYLSVPTAKDQARFQQELAGLPSTENALKAAQAVQAAYESTRPKTRQVPGSLKPTWREPSPWPSARASAIRL